MINVLDMNGLMHIKLFVNITGVNTRFCFKYNDTLIFCVPRFLISKAVGENGKNVRKLSEILRKKIKIIPIPKTVEDSSNFIQSLVSPLKLREIKTIGDEIVITAGNQNKAILIGRNKTRLMEMRKIIEGFFKKHLKII